MKPTTIAILGGIAALTAIYLARQAAVGGAAILQTVGDAVDPTNPNNIAASGINKVGAIIVTSDNGRNADGTWTLGGWIYDVTHPVEHYYVSNITNPAATSYW